MLSLGFDTLIYGGYIDGSHAVYRISLKFIGLQMGHNPQHGNGMAMTIRLMDVPTLDTFLRSILTVASVWNTREIANIYSYSKLKWNISNNFAESAIYSFSCNKTKSPCMTGWLMLF